MSIISAHAAAFYAEVTDSETVWALRDADGFPAPSNVDGQRTMPFWSRQSRAELVVSHVPAYVGFDVEPGDVQRKLDALGGKTNG